MSYTPSIYAIQKLKQFGFNRGQINDFTHIYSETSINYDDDDFVRFALRAGEKQASKLILLNPNWSPSPHVVQYLASVRISQNVFSEYLDAYITLFSNKEIPTAFWDDHFIRWSKQRWHVDARNTLAPSGSFMVRNWKPSDETLKNLQAEGMNEDCLSLLASEFCLYWQEKQEKRANWESTFSWWARKKWSVEKL